MWSKTSSSLWCESESVETTQWWLFVSFSRSRERLINIALSHSITLIWWKTSSGHRRKWKCGDKTIVDFCLFQSFKAFPRVRPSPFFDVFSSLLTLNIWYYKPIISGIEFWWNSFFLVRQLDFWKPRYILGAVDWKGHRHHQKCSVFAKVYHWHTLLGALTYGDKLSQKP